jgi:IclR family transcriptional regulator, mhp operon transcriptional activator
MTRNVLVLAALAAADDGIASSEELAEATFLHVRTVRRAIRSLISQGLAWSPQRGVWELTLAGRAVVAGLHDDDEQDDSGAEPRDRTVLEALWSEGLGALWRGDTRRSGSGRHGRR